MTRTTIEIKVIDNGWLLSICGCDMKVAAPENKYFKTLGEVLEYLKVNEHILK